MRPIDGDKLKRKVQRIATEAWMMKLTASVETTLNQFIDYIDDAPSIEPNLILPEQMGRGDIYEVGETIVVMNHDDYYDLLCKSWVPKRGEWIDFKNGWKCSACGKWNNETTNFCPNCGARMFAKDTNVPNKEGADDE